MIKVIEVQAVTEPPPQGTAPDVLLTANVGWVEGAGAWA